MCLPYLRSLAQWLLHPLSLEHSSVSLPRTFNISNKPYSLFFPTVVNNTHTVIRFLQTAWIAVLTKFLPSNGLYVSSPISSSFVRSRCSLFREAAILILREPNRTGTVADHAVVVVEVTNSVDESPEMITLAMVSERYASASAFNLQRIELMYGPYSLGALPPPLPLNMRLPS